MTEDKIEKVVCEIFSIRQTDLCIKTRKRDIVVPRQVCMTLLMDRLKYSSGVAASIYHLSNHATALHAKKTVENLYQTDKGFKEKIDIIHELLPRNYIINTFIPRGLNLLEMCISYTKKLHNEQKYISGVV